MRNYINKFIFIFSALMLLSFLLHPALASEGTENNKLKTPCGSEVTTISKTEGSQEHLQKVTDDFIDQHSDVTIIGNSSELYNCFGYSFHMYPENKMDEKMNFDDISPYITDGSYKLYKEIRAVDIKNSTSKDDYLNELYNNASSGGVWILVYFNERPLHAAVVTNRYNVFKAKLGNGPLVEHGLEFKDYYNITAYFKLYKKSDACPLKDEPPALSPPQNLVIVAQSSS